LAATDTHRRTRTRTKNINHEAIERGHERRANGKKLERSGN
jgi:hypothetical protein